MAPGQVVGVRVDLRQFNAWSRGAIEKQIPFATAKALSRLAVLGRNEVRDDLPEHFKIRSTWVSRGIQAVPAKKSDWPRPTAVVGVRDQFMELQETGGDKVATTAAPTGPGRVAVPSRVIVRAAGGRIPKRLKPRIILSGKNAFKTDRHGGAIELRGPKMRGRAAPLTLLFFLRQRTHIRARFQFRRTVLGAFQAVWDEAFTEALQDALKTPKPTMPRP